MTPGYEWRRKASMRHHPANPIALASVAAALMLAAAGCPGPGDECIVGAEACPCTSAGACDPGLQCLSNRCVDPSRTGINTVDGGVSGNGRPIGASCAEPGECGEGLCLNPQALPGGYCSKTCGGQLLNLTDSCPAGSACTQLNEATSMCMALCGGGSDPCRAGYVCAASAGASVCLPRCQNDRSCRPGYGCNTATGLCQLGAREGGRAGAACSADSQCGSNLCLTETLSEGKFPDGYCTRACTAAEEDKPCAGDDGVCIGVSRGDGTKNFLCFGSCNTGVDCRGQYFCSADISVRTGGGLGVCVPRCEKLGCREGFTCDPTVGACTMGGETSGPVQVDRQDLGVVVLGQDGLDFKTITVDVPADAVSFSIVAEPVNPGSAAAGLVRITTPNGQVVYDFFDFMTTAYRKPAGGLYNDQPFVMIYPNAPRVNVVPGRYQVVLATTATGKIPFKVTLLMKRQSGVLKGGTLPAMLWFSKQKYLNAQTAQTDPRFQNALATMTQIYESIGVTLGPFIYNDLPPESESLAVIQDRQQVGRLFALGKGDTRALNFYFIDQFNLEGGSGVIGMSGGIPGPICLPGLPRGGVAVALSVLGRSQSFATAMAHEAGHYLGLYHVSESNGRSFDPLQDTLECPASADTNADMKVDSRECQDKGADNLMFWQASGIKFSNDQRFVVLRNPILQ
jgi:hypothetical protein